MARDGYPALDLLHSHFLFADNGEWRRNSRFANPGTGSLRPEQAV
jgi:hypothetical protein